MVRHSKNNTAKASFTKDEYGKLRDVWGSKQVRLGAESMRNFDQCSICLNTTERPVTCLNGHLFCKECIITSLLDQKREFAQVQTSLERLEREHEKDRQNAREKAMLYVQKNFEQIDSGVGNSDRKREYAQRRSRSPLEREESQKRNRSRSPIGRQNTLSDLPARIAAQTERRLEEIMERMKEDQAQAKKDKIPAYWLPSLTPSAEISKEEIVKRTEDALRKGIETKCFIGDKFGHPISIKSLIDVEFVLDTAIENGQMGAATETKEKRKICPSCKKGLSNVNKLFVIRKCGHVHCSTCVEQLILPALKKSENDKQFRPSCLECDSKIKSKEKDLISLQREGTGFVSAGNSESKKVGISFQG